MAFIPSSGSVPGHVIILLVLAVHQEVSHCIGINGLSIWRLFSPPPTLLGKNGAGSISLGGDELPPTTRAYTYSPLKGELYHPTESTFYPTTPGDATAFEIWEQEQEAKYAKEILQTLSSPNDTLLQTKAKTLIANFLVHVAVDNVTGHGATTDPTKPDVALKQEISFPQISSKQGFGIISSGAEYLQGVESWTEDDDSFSTPAVTTTKTTGRIRTTTTTESAIVDTSPMSTPNPRTSTPRSISTAVTTTTVANGEQYRGGQLSTKFPISHPSDVIQFEIPQSAILTQKENPWPVRIKHVIQKQDGQGQYAQQQEISQFNPSGQGNQPYGQNVNAQSTQEQNFQQFPQQLQSTQEQIVQNNQYVQEQQNYPIVQEQQNFAQQNQNQAVVQNTNTNYEDLLKAALEIQGGQEIPQSQIQITQGHPNYEELLAAAIELERQQQSQVPLSSPQQGAGEPPGPSTGPGGFNPIKSILSVLNPMKGDNSSGAEGGSPLMAIFNRFGPRPKTSTPKSTVSTTTEEGDYYVVPVYPTTEKNTISLHGADLMNQVGRLRENVGKRNLTGVLDESLRIASLQTIGVLVTGFLDLLLCNPVDRWNGNCNPKTN